MVNGGRGAALTFSGDPTAGVRKSRFSDCAETHAIYGESTFKPSKRSKRNDASLCVAPSHTFDAGAYATLTALSPCVIRRLPLSANFAQCHDAGLSTPKYVPQTQQRVTHALPQGLYAPFAFGAGFRKGRQLY